MAARETYPINRRNLEYAHHPGQQLLLDVYRPNTQRRVPVVIYFHDGGWRSGSKDHCKIQFLTRYGFAVVSANYRLLPRHQFPTQIHDAKCVVRYLRANADLLGLEPEQIVASGISAGAYLACMLGLTAGKAEFEGPEDQELFYADQPSHVNAVVNYFAFTDFQAMQNERTRRGNLAERSPEAKLLGRAVSLAPELARHASPISHIHADAPPFLHIHGDFNDVIPLDQSRRFHLALEELQVTSKITIVRGAGHRSKHILTSPSIQDRVGDFLHRHLGTPGGMRAVNEEVRNQPAAIKRKPPYETPPLVQSASSPEVDGPPPKPSDSDIPDAASILPTLSRDQPKPNNTTSPSTEKNEPWQAPGWESNNTE